VSAILQHVPSGESISATAPVPLAKNDPQGAGSAITYGRRYALGMLLGLVAEEDDDAQAAMQGTRNGTNGAKPKSAGIVTTAALRRQLDDLGQQVYAERWPQVCARNCQRISDGATELLGDLTTEQLQKLIAGLRKLQRQRETATPNTPRL
jgi:hypothetical protein